MPSSLRSIYVSLPREAAERLVSASGRYAVPTTAALLVCRHYGIEWSPRPNAPIQWKLSEEERERVRAEYARRSKRPYEPVAERKAPPKRRRHDYPPEWDLLPEEERRRRMALVRVRAYQKRCRRQIRELNESRRALEAYERTMEHGIPNYREVGMLVPNCLSCVHYDGGLCSRYGKPVGEAYSCSNQTEVGRG